MKSLRCRGQATAEFIVLMLALVPLLLIVPLLGKYIDMMHSAEAASRYVAFQGMVHHSGTRWRDDARLAEEVRRRFFSTSNADIKTNDVAGNFDAHRNLVWRDHAGRPLLTDFASQVAVSTARSSFNFYGPNRLVWREGLELPEDNFYAATVTVEPENVPGLEPFDAINLRISRRTALLTDSWAASSPNDVRRRVENPLILPASELKDLYRVQSEFMQQLNDPAIEPELPNWEEVPCDRIARCR